MPLLILLVLVPSALVALVVAGVRIVPAQEQLVVFRLGRFSGVRRPGLNFLLPLLDQGVRVDMRERLETIEGTEVLMRKRATMHLDIEYVWRVVDPAASVLNVADAGKALPQMLRTTLQILLADLTPADVFAEHVWIENDLAARIGERIKDWGIVLERVTLTNMK